MAAKTSKKSRTASRRPAKAKKVSAAKPIEQPIPSIHEWTHDLGFVRGLKCLRKDRTAHGGFRYPEEGDWASAETWVADTRCGNGLHFWPWGIGIGDGADISVVNDVFAVVEANPDEVVGNVGDGQKAKAKRLRVVKYGSLAESHHRCDGLWRGAIRRLRPRQ